MKLDTTTFQYPTFENALSVMPLADAVEPGDAPVQITYDVSEPSAFTLHNVYGCEPDPLVAEIAAEVIDSASELLRPFEISYLSGLLMNDESLDPVPLDGFRAICGAQMLYAYACEFPELEGAIIAAIPTFSLVSRAGVEANLEVCFHVTADAATMADAVKAAAFQRYADWARKTWGKLVLSVIGPWAVDSGIEELRLRGVFVPTRSHGLDAFLSVGVTEDTAAK
jgi:hypothetical protein